MMAVRHILRIKWDRLFTRQAWQVDRGADFQQRRWRLFTAFTLPSLQRQSVPWQAWLWADPELRALHAELPITDSRVRFVYDLDQEAATIAAAHDDQNVIVGRIDSDDMLGPDALESLERSEGVNAAKPYLQLFTGCAYDESRNLVLPWRNPSPAFVFRPVSAADLAAGFPSLGGKHSHVHRESVHVHTPAPAFCVVLHGTNLSNSPQESFAKGRVSRSAERDIRARFNLPASPGVFERVARLWS